MGDINNDVKDELILNYGIDKAIEFCKMANMMYRMMYDDLVKKGFTGMELQVYQYDYESEWWKNKYKELKTRKDARTRIN